MPDHVELALTLDVPRELAERLSATAIREGKNLEAFVAEILTSAEKVMVPPIWLDELGNRRPVRPCSRFGQDAPILRLRIEHLRLVGCRLFEPASSVNLCGHAEEQVLRGRGWDRPFCDRYWRLSDRDFRRRRAPVRKSPVSSPEPAARIAPLPVAPSAALNKSSWR